ncbi:MAG: MAPEG family protein [Acidobacteriota bacterium]|jgi:uncharacterized MAPEG superfamily protein
MEIHMWSIVVAWLVVYFTKLPVAVAMQRAGGYDNRLPRAQQARLEGWGARSVAAHKNGFESFAPFAAAVLVAHLGGGPARMIDLLAIVFVIARVGYVICYLADWASLRSAVWSVGFLVTFALFLAPLFS